MNGLASLLGGSPAYEPDDERPGPADLVDDRPYPWRGEHSCLTDAPHPCHRCKAAR